MQSVSPVLTRSSPLGALAGNVIFCLVVSHLHLSLSQFGRLFKTQVAELKQPFLSVPHQNISSCLIPKSKLSHTALLQGFLLAYDRTCLFCEKLLLNSGILHCDVIVLL